MKTIRQIAEEIGASKQAVYKRYKGKLYNAVLPHARVVAGTIYILEQGEAIIKRDFSRAGAYGGAHTAYAPDKVISMLQKELDMKNKQIADLIATVKMQAMGAVRKPKSRGMPPKKTPKKPAKRSPKVEQHIERLAGRT